MQLQILLNIQFNLQVWCKFLCLWVSLFSVGLNSHMNKPCKSDFGIRLYLLKIMKSHFFLVCSVLVMCLSHSLCVCMCIYI